MKNIKNILLLIFALTCFLCTGQEKSAIGNDLFPNSGIISPFRFNHVGFMPGAHKLFVIDDPGDILFEVFERKDVEYYKVYEGTLKEIESELPGKWLGDFSTIRQPGNYVIRCGGRESRHFSIYEKIYDVPQRLLFNFFTWQRCGSNKGWAGECHLEDGIIKETNEHKDFTGGYHQSGDLRKSLDGVAIGVIGMIKYALLNEEAPHWDQGAISEEIRWACDYYQKVIHPDGFMHDGLFIPFGWGPRYYYNSPAALSEQWNSLILLALGSQYFYKTGDDDYAEKCLNAALKIWDFLNSENGPVEAYRPPEPIPWGMGTVDAYYQVYKGSADYIGFKLCAAAELYRASKKLEMLHEVAQCANLLCELQIEKSGDIITNPISACFWESHNSTRIAGTGSTYCSLHVEMGLCEAIDLMPDRDYTHTWILALTNIIMQYQNMAKRNIWDRIPQKWTIQDSPAAADNYVCGNYLINGVEHPVVYSYGRGNARISYQGIVLIKAARLLRQPDLLRLAQRQADWILGANPYDISSVESVGFNQMSLPMWGQFFPNTPQIPGGVIVGLEANARQAPPGNSEYDMPNVGYLMWLLSELKSSY